MRLFLLNILLAIAWAAVTGSFAPATLLAGFAFGYAALLLAKPAFGPSAYHIGVWRAIAFLGFFVKELVLSSLRVAHDVLTPGYMMKPGIVAVPLRAKTDVEITVLANLISLTPGTLSIDVSRDRSVLYVHAMYDADDPDSIRRAITNKLETRVLRLFRGRID